MGNYLLRRLIIALPSLIGISLILFVLLSLAPGDPSGELVANRRCGNDAATVGPFLRGDPRAVTRVERGAAD